VKPAPLLAIYSYDPMTPPPPPTIGGAVIVMPLTFPRSRLFDAVGDPVKVKSRNAVHDAVELAASATGVEEASVSDDRKICALELPAQLKAPDTVVVPEVVNCKKFGAVMVRDANVLPPLTMAHRPDPEDAPKVTLPCDSPTPVNDRSAEAPVKTILADVFPV